MAATDGWRAALAELVTAPAGVACGNVAVVMMPSRPGKPPGEAMATLSMFVFAGLIFAYIPFQGFVERARMVPSPPRPRVGKPPVVDLEAKG